MSTEDFNDFILILQVGNTFSLKAAYALQQLTNLVVF